MDHQQWKYEERGARRQKVIENEEISNLTPEDFRRLHALELRYSVKITVQREAERIMIDGRYEDVLQVFGEILEFLHEVEKDKQKRIHAEMLSKAIQWQYEEYGAFEDYDGNLNAQMTMEDEEGIATGVKRIDLRKGTMTACALSASLNNASVAFCQSS